MFYYLLAIFSLLFLVVAIVAFILYWRGVRISKSREQRETEEGLQKAFGHTRWGLLGGAESETRDHFSHSHHSDSGGGHDGGGGGDGGGD
jgi:uncharacterized membrane protein YgcG